MKNKFSKILAPLLVTAAMTANADTGKPAATSAPVRVRSTFTQPKQFSEGRDPFYPESTRVFQAVMAESPNSHKADVSALVVKGYYRDSKGAFVIINNHTFTTGDEGNVITPGGRIHLKCVDVLPNVVIIECNGSMHQLPINLPK